MVRPGITRDRWIALFLFGIAAFSPPLLFIFSAEVMLLGIPLLYIYIFVIWGVIIALTAWIAEAQAVLETRERLRSRKNNGDWKKTS